MTFLDRVAALGPDEIDRLGLAAPPPLAFVASIRRFLARNGHRARWPRGASLRSPPEGRPGRAGRPRRGHQLSASSSCSRASWATS